MAVRKKRSDERKKKEELMLTESGDEDRGDEQPVVARYCLLWEGKCLEAT